MVETKAELSVAMTDASWVERTVANSVYGWVDLMVATLAAVTAAK